MYPMELTILLPSDRTQYHVLSSDLKVHPAEGVITYFFEIGCGSDACGDKLCGFCLGFSWR